MKKDTTRIAPESSSAAMKMFCTTVSLYPPFYPLAKFFESKSELNGNISLATVIGFCLWYTRVQVHQDRILVAQPKQITEPKSQI
jgi:hypothetical protein